MSYPELMDVLKAFDATERDAREVTRDLSEERAAWRAEPGSWSAQLGPAPAPSAATGDTRRLVRSIARAARASATEAPRTRGDQAATLAATTRSDVTVPRDT